MLTLALFELLGLSAAARSSARPIVVAAAAHCVNAQPNHFTRAGTAIVRNLQGGSGENAMPAKAWTPRALNTATQRRARM